MKNTYESLDAKHEGNRLLGRHRLKWEGIIRNKF